jgi:hypothetical protein
MQLYARVVFGDTHHFADLVISIAIQVKHDYGTIDFRELCNSTIEIVGPIGI